MAPPMKEKNVPSSPAVANNLGTQKGGTFKNLSFHRSKAVDRPTAVSIPYAEVPGLDCSAPSYHRAEYFLSKAVPSGPHKKAKLESRVANISAPGNGESSRIERLTTEVDRLSSISPLVNLENAGPEMLHAFSNFLRVELDTIAHSVQHYSQLYNHTLLELQRINEFRTSLNTSGPEHTSGTVNGSVQPVASGSGTHHSESLLDLED